MSTTSVRIDEGLLIKIYKPENVAAVREKKAAAKLVKRDSSNRRLNSVLVSTFNYEPRNRSQIEKSFLRKCNGIIHCELNP